MTAKRRAAYFALALLLLAIAAAVICTVHGVVADGAVGL